METVVHHRIGKRDDIFLKKYYLKFFAIQKKFESNERELYSAFDLQFIIDNQIYNINLIYHPLALKVAFFYEKKQTIKDLDNTIDLIKRILTYELTKPVKEETIVFTTNDIKQTILLLRKLEKRNNFFKNKKGAN